MTVLDQVTFDGGYAVLFFWILANRAGVPLPATPALLGAGVLAGAGQLRFSLVLGLVTIATLASDSLWFWLGRRYGHRILNLLCRFSMEPENCIRRTEHFLIQHGVRSLLVTKFIPGMNRTVLPLTGTARTTYPRFLGWDTAGTILWVLVYAGLGYIFSTEIQEAAGKLLRIGGWVGLALFAAFAYAAIKVINRRRVLYEVVERISAGDLHKRITGGEKVAVIDLRDPAELVPDQRTIPGALRMLPAQAEEYWKGLPEGVELVLYCT